jgi:hypothetical protein
MSPSLRAKSTQYVAHPEARDGQVIAQMKEISVMLEMECLQDEVTVDMGADPKKVSGCTGAGV